MDGVLLYTCCPLSHPHSTVRFLMNDLPLYFALTFITILSPGAGVLFTVMSALRSGFQDAWQAPLGNVLASAMHRLTALHRSQTLRLPSITRQHPMPNGRTAPRFLRQPFCCS